MGLGSLRLGRSRSGKDGSKEDFAHLESDESWNGIRPPRTELIWRQGYRELRGHSSGLVRKKEWPGVGSSRI
ncbi:hypothetical protein KFK09_026469 [Dendrobium nobile]|uniref:Uncharacterized protein n=1 Tax=Dendrobium nobile TaxID=94219 RepID=A0A8T3A8U4_DENNO|nr:hypothetical protein KFK09_026469 [Dendrobium nobile]